MTREDRELISHLQARIDRLHGELAIAETALLNIRETLPQTQSEAWYAERAERALKELAAIRRASL